jgi:hypothetical protein
MAATGPLQGSNLDIQKKYMLSRGAMGILTVRLSEEEERLLTRRSQSVRMKRATYVRMLIREEPFLTGADVVEDAARRMGDKRLRVSRRK